VEGRPLFAHPEIFFKPPSALQNPGDPIRIPRDATDVHYEGELVDDHRHGGFATQRRRKRARGSSA
jgi:hypothetical protein